MSDEGLNESRSTQKSRTVLVLLLILGAAGLWWWLRPAGNDPRHPAHDNSIRATPSAPAGDEATPGGPTTVPPGAVPVDPGPAANAPEDPSRSPTETEPDSKVWPGIQTDLHDAPRLYWTRLKGDWDYVYRKPKDNPEPLIVIHRGQLIEVLAEEGPEVDVGGERVATKPVRVGDARGWLPETALERTAEELPIPEPVSLWGMIRAAAGDPSIPEDCPIAMLQLDFAPEYPGLEFLAYSISGDLCRHAIGVFRMAGDTPALLGYAANPQMLLEGAFAYAGGPDLVEVTSYWREKLPQPGMYNSGAKRLLLRTPAVPGPMDVVFEADDHIIDNSNLPPRYVISRFAKPDMNGDGTWVMHQRRTERTPGPNGTDVDRAQEHVFAYDGARFVEVPRPPALPELAPPPPSQTTSPAEKIYELEPE